MDDSLKVKLKDKMRKSFTLLELSMVIAIIGILATVVLVNLNSSKLRARDSVIRADISQIHALMESYYNNHSNYNGLACTYNSTPTPCKSLTNETNIAGLAKDICNQQGTGSCVGGAIAQKRGLTIKAAAATATDPPKYVIFAFLPSRQTAANNKYFCADSTGQVKESDSLPPAMICP